MLERTHFIALRHAAAWLWSDSGTRQLGASRLAGWPVVDRDEVNAVVVVYVVDNTSYCEAMGICRATLSWLVVGLLSSSCGLLNRTYAAPPNRCDMYGVALVVDLVATTVSAIAIGNSEVVDKHKTLWLVPGTLAVSSVVGIVGAIMCKQETAAYERTPHEVTLPMDVPPAAPAAAVPPAAPAPTMPTAAPAPAADLPAQPLRMR